jgi:UDP-N-acetylmuramoyl-L-alanyl-D-glutamate--2,6-diaminopimelate ligase
VGDGSVSVTDASHDSRNIGPGFLFLAVPGKHFDGHDFAAQAVNAGAVAVCGQRIMEVSVPQLLVADTRRSMPDLAAEIHRHPDRAMRLVGVTGTNGKTTVTHLVEAIGKAAGETVGLIGTIETRVGSQKFPNPRTTPEATDLQRLLRSMADAGAGMAALEVSSHALALGRASQVSFEVGAFTNLGRDHLDLHGDVESYFVAKSRLFEQSRRAVAWVEDPSGRPRESRVVGGGAG